MAFNYKYRLRRGGALAMASISNAEIGLLCVEDWAIGDL